MNPLTQVKNTQKATKSEILLGLSESASWHARFKHSAYIFAGGLDYDLTEGDMLAVFAQYGEVVDVHLVRDKSTGKSRGFCFLAYEDQRSTVLAVDNLSGAKVAGRIIRVEHVDNYKKKKAEMEGEDPNKVSDDDQPPPQLELLEPAGGGPHAKGRGEEPKGGPVGGSMHEILAEGARIRQQQLAAKEKAAAAAQGQDGEGKKKVKKDKKEKKP
eukprot:CAMPEP_0202388870 /NCGR_PEP_ID=MMETSP1127-20130417/79900_1 /ASSEMBLY_ACC=CAM_ASM_000462 /TAXON_ID=3047 /ORGANISM="Dunaliella tertiolecta, Strain CCMP1320" /LENGTH=213 /DNA_ID=CAMNT_0048990437 /DNA_START=42 /DNA_END=680 /DNA_ORIENTATION=+